MPVCSKCDHPAAITIRTWTTFREVHACDCHMVQVIREVGSEPHFIQAHDTTCPGTVTMPTPWARA